jgi:hypothetical protein
MVPVGNYRITFSELEGYEIPSPIVVSVNKNETTNVNVEYVPVNQGIARGERGVFGGGSGGSNTSRIDYVAIATTGDAINFGNLTVGRYSLAACSNGERGVFGGGTTGYTSLIDYVTIATTGNAVKFGNLTFARAYLSACSGN